MAIKIPAVKLTLAEDREYIGEKVKEILASGRMILGEYTRAFEDGFKNYLQAGFATAVSTATAGLEIALRCLNVAGREVIVPTNTNYATAAAVVFAGGIPVFADMDEESFSINLRDLQSKVTERTAGIIVVHIGGFITPEISNIQRYAAANGLFLLEDAAHAHGTVYLEKQAGTFGDIGVFSFYPTKVMTTSEGGMIITNNEYLHKETLYYRDQGKEEAFRCYHIRMGNSYRMGEINALMGLTQLAKLERMIEERNRVARIYDSYFTDHPHMQVIKVPNQRSNYYKYIMVLDAQIDVEQVKAWMLQEKGVQSGGEVYRYALHEQPVFAQWVKEGESFPVAERILKQQYCPPCYPDLTDEEAHYVAQSLLEIIEQG